MAERYDIAIIGAGAAGEAAAHYAGSRKARVAVIERDLFGGGCPLAADPEGVTSRLPGPMNRAVPRMGVAPADSRAFTWLESSG